MTIDPTALDSICSLMEKERIIDTVQPYTWKDPALWPDDSMGDAHISQFYTLGNSINFRYWWIDPDGKFKHCSGIKNGISMKGSSYMWRSLKVCCDDEVFPILDSKKLSKITLDDVKDIFRDDEGAVPMPACPERLKNWRDLGKKLYEYWSGEFYNLLKETKGSLYDFVQYSRQFRAFDDPLCKMTMVNAIMHKGRGLVKFDQSIFPAIDDKLPHQQVRIGLLILDRKLENKLRRREYLSPQETRELRNASLQAFIFMMKKTGIGGDVIDNIFWLNRRNCDSDRPVCEDDGEIEKCLFHKACKQNTEYRFHLTKNTRYF